MSQQYLAVVLSRMGAKLCCIRKAVPASKYLIYKGQTSFEIASRKFLLLFDKEWVSDLPFQSFLALRFRGAGAAAVSLGSSSTCVPKIGSLTKFPFYV